jgi:hypothetical protein
VSVDRSKQSDSGLEASRVRRSKSNRPAAKQKGRRRESPPPRRTRRQPTTYARELLAGLRQWLPRRGLPLQVEDRRVTWTPRLLVICAILMALSKAQTLGDRFADARLATVQMYKSRRRPGESYEGFIATLAKQSQRLMDLICTTLRQMIREMAKEHWTVEGWALFGVDGTRLECPMTLANEQALGCAGRNKTTPQQYLTMLLHLGTGLPWGFVRGPGGSSERSHLVRMLPLLPAGAMVVADAGLVGYDVLRSINDGGHQFVIRVGSNVSLLRKLGHVREHEGIVYLWPWCKQRRSRTRRLPANLAAHARKVDPPLVLRLEVFNDGRRPVYLLSSVLESKALSNRTMARIYRRRWHLELYYRSLKQTLGRRKMLSDGPGHAGVELDWCMMGLWVLGAMTVKALIASGQSPGQGSVAAALRIVREAMDKRRQRWRRGGLGKALAAAKRDEYRRRGPKQSRQRKSKKTEHPPGAPQTRLATAQERRLALELRRLAHAA